MANLPLRTIAFAVTTLVLLYAFFGQIRVICKFPIVSLPLKTTMAATSDLAIALAQTSKAPPTLSITVKNTHSYSPVTFVTWNTPLDGAALPLGVLRITDPTTGDRLNKDTIKMARKTPPAADQFVTLKPGETKEQSIELRSGPLVPLDSVKGGKVEVSVAGEWRDVWVGEQVGPEEWEEKAGKGVKGGFESDVLVMEL